jgi:hypothetical protein
LIPLSSTLFCAFGFLVFIFSDFNLKIFVPYACFSLLPKQIYTYNIYMHACVSVHLFSILCVCFT